MKKIFILTLLIFITTFSITSAENNDRWYWLTSSDKLTTYVDILTLKYNSNLDTVDFWMKAVIPSDDKFFIFQGQIDFKNRTTSFYENYEYTLSTGELIQQFYSGSTMSIIPNTIGEYWAYVIANLVGRTGNF